MASKPAESGRVLLASASSKSGERHPGPAGGERTPPTSPDLTALQAFEQVFWPAYPRKIAKHMARKAWEHLHLRDDDQRTLDAIMYGLAEYKRREWLDRDPRFIPHPATWLNQHRWEDFQP